MEATQGNDRPAPTRRVGSWRQRRKRDVVISTNHGRLPQQQEEGQMTDVEESDELCMGSDTGKVHPHSGDGKVTGGGEGRHSPGDEKHSKKNVLSTMKQVAGSIVKRKGGRGRKGTNRNSVALASDDEGDLLRQDSAAGSSHSFSEDEHFSDDHPASPGSLSKAHRKHAGGPRLPKKVASTVRQVASRAILSVKSPKLGRKRTASPPPPRKDEGKDKEDCDEKKPDESEVVGIHNQTEEVMDEAKSSPDSSDVRPFDNDTLSVPKLPPLSPQAVESAPKVSPLSQAEGVAAESATRNSAQESPYVRRSSKSSAFGLSPLPLPMVPEGRDEDHSSTSFGNNSKLFAVADKPPLASPARTSPSPNKKRNFVESTMQRMAASLSPAPNLVRRGSKHGFRGRANQQPDIPPFGVSKEGQETEPQATMKDQHQQQTPPLPARRPPRSEGRGVEATSSLGSIRTNSGASTGTSSSATTFSSAPSGSSGGSNGNQNSNNSRRGSGIVAGLSSLSLHSAPSLRSLSSANGGASTFSLTSMPSLRSTGGGWSTHSLNSTRSFGTGFSESSQLSAHQLSLSSLPSLASIRGYELSDLSPMGPGDSSSVLSSQHSLPQGAFMLNLPVHDEENAGTTVEVLAPVVSHPKNTVHPSQVGEPRDDNSRWGSSEFGSPTVPYRRQSSNENSDDGIRTGLSSLKAQAGLDPPLRGPAAVCDRQGKKFPDAPPSYTRKKSADSQEREGNSDQGDAAPDDDDFNQLGEELTVPLRDCPPVIVRRQQTEGCSESTPSGGDDEDDDDLHRNDSKSLVDSAPMLVRRKVSVDVAQATERREAEVAAAEAKAAASVANGDDVPSPTAEEATATATTSTLVLKDSVPMVARRLNSKKS